MKDVVWFGDDKLEIEDVVRIATGEAVPQIKKNPDFVSKIDKGAQLISKLIEEDGHVYGVTTGYGDSCTVNIPRDQVDELPLNLIKMHTCGMGDNFTKEESRAIQATRLASLCNGLSGVRMTLLEQISTYVENDVIPRIPQEGSVGASGDLTPLSYVAASLIGDGECFTETGFRSTSELIKEKGIEPITLKPKEALAIMNGTAVMTALACLAYKRAEYLVQMASRITSMAAVALKGNYYHFDEDLFAAKPHPGQNEVAAWIRSDLVTDDTPVNSDRIQDRYSIRCAPHVIGVLNDALPYFRQVIETELNSSNDNPIVDGEAGRIHHGGHFYGGHIAFVMDSMKNLIANIADLIDRQMALLMDTKFNNGLPANLSFASRGSNVGHHGFKAVQIGASSWTAEALKLTMPASVFSRSTECHNQDKVSMGTIAARDCLRVLQLTEQVAAAGLISSSQAIKIRLMDNEISESELTVAHKDQLDSVMSNFNFLDTDLPLESSLRSFTKDIQDAKWKLYS